MSGVAGSLLVVGLLVGVVGVLVCVVFRECSVYGGFAMVEGGVVGVVGVYVVFVRCDAVRCSIFADNRNTVCVQCNVFRTS